MRAGILVHLVEPMPMDESNPIENYHAIRNELVQYNEELGARPELIAVTKAELPGAVDVFEMLKKDLGRDDLLLISAVTGQGLNHLASQIAKMLAEQKSR